MKTGDSSHEAIAYAESILQQMEEMGYTLYPVAMREVRGVLPPDTVNVWPDLTGRLLYRGNGNDIPPVALIEAFELSKWLKEAKNKQAAMLAMKQEREVCRP